jgi:hypothetical protein
MHLLTTLGSFDGLILLLNLLVQQVDVRSPFSNIQAHNLCMGPVQIIA